MADGTLKDRFRYVRFSAQRGNCGHAVRALVEAAWRAGRSAALDGDTRELRDYVQDTFETVERSCEFRRSMRPPALSGKRKGRLGGARRRGRKQRCRFGVNKRNGKCLKHPRRKR